MNSREVGKCGHNAVYPRNQFTWCQIHTLYHVCRCVKENPWAAVELNAAVSSALKNELLEVFLDQVWNNKALNEHITIPLPKISSPQSILRSCTVHLKRCFLPLIKNNWLSVLTFGGGFHLSWMAECVTGLGVGRYCYKAPCAHREGIPKSSLPDEMALPSRQG